jgi:flagellar biosynthetic protein FliP
MNTLPPKTDSRARPGTSSFVAADVRRRKPAATTPESASSRRRLRTSVSWGGALALLVFLLLALAPSASAQTNLITGFGPVQISLGSNNGPQDVDSAIKILFVITLLSLAPAILLLMTCFTRIVIVLSFVRTALQLQGTPANQIIIGLSLFMTYFVMAPVWENIHREALAPYQANQITSAEAIHRASGQIRSFMLKQARPKDVELFVAMAKIQPTAPDELPLRVVIPGFIISELRTAFQMGFLIFVPFILIDLVVATVLMSMGMMMMPPTTFSLPLKLLLFVLVDGWELVVRSLIRSFGM